MASRDMSSLQRELDRTAQRSSRQSSGSGDFQWMSPPKPVRKGEKTRLRLRILPRKEEGSDDYCPEWWVRADQHVLTIDGSTKVFNCPDDHDNPDGGKVCPLCSLRRELYKERTPASQELAKDLKVRSRCFAAVVLPESQGGEQGPFVWGYSNNLNNAVVEIAVAKSCFIDDPDEGRDMMLTTSRIGPRRFDIRYSITDMDPSPLADDLRKLMDDAAPDLSKLTKDADLAELNEIAAVLDPRPGSKRATPAGTASAPVRNASVQRREPEAQVAEDTAPATFYYSGAGGEQSGLDGDGVAALVAEHGGDEHHVWKDGWSEWKMVGEVGEVMELVKKLTVPKTITPPAPPAAPAKAGGPPSPPRPPGGSAF
jgi:hypothetical protein